MELCPGGCPAGQVCDFSSGSCVPTRPEGCPLDMGRHLSMAADSSGTLHLAFYDQCLETDLGSIHFASYDRLPFSIRGFKPSRTVFNALIKASENLNVSSMRGIILTSDRFDAKSSTWRDIRMKVPWRIVGVDMESAAFAQACSRFGVRYGVVKVATDTVGPASPIQFIMNFRRLAPLPVRVALEATRMMGSRG